MNRNERIRKEILFQLYAVRPLSRTAEKLAHDCKLQGDDYSLSEVSREVQFLTDESLLVQSDEPGSTQKRYRISAQGVRHYEQNFAA